MGAETNIGGSRHPEESSERAGVDQPPKDSGSETGHSAADRNALVRLGDCHFRREVVIVNEMGLHARPASQLVSLSNRFNCEVVIQKGSEQVDGKSILQLLSLSAEAGTPLILETRGPEAEDAITALSSLVARGFDEMETSDR